MPKIRDFRCYFDGKELLTDAFGNNAAFACPNCSHPVLLVTYDNNQRGMSEGNPSKCRKCNNEYWQESIIEEEKKIILQSKG